MPCHHISPPAHISESLATAGPGQQAVFPLSHLFVSEFTLSACAVSSPPSWEELLSTEEQGWVPRKLSWCCDAALAAGTSPAAPAGPWEGPRPAVRPLHTCGWSHHPLSRSYSSLLGVLRLTLVKGTRSLDHHSSLTFVLVALHKLPTSSTQHSSVKFHSCFCSSNCWEAWLVWDKRMFLYFKFSTFTFILLIYMLI